MAAPIAVFVLSFIELTNATYPTAVLNPDPVANERREDVPIAIFDPDVWFDVKAAFPTAILSLAVVKEFNE